MHACEKALLSLLQRITHEYLWSGWLLIAAPEHPPKGWTICNMCNIKGASIGIQLLFIYLSYSCNTHHQIFRQQGPETSAFLELDLHSTPSLRSQWRFNQDIPSSSIKPWWKRTLVPEPSHGKQIEREGMWPWLERIIYNAIMGNMITTRPDSSLQSGRAGSVPFESNE